MWRLLQTAAATAMLTLPSSARPARIQDASEYPATGSKQQQWQFVTALAAQGFEVKAKESTLSGAARDKLFRQRALKFHWAARAARSYVGRHFVQLSARPTPAYVYAAFTVGLYAENAGEIWSARRWFGEAHKFNQVLLRGGKASPLYNGTPISALLPSRMQRLDRLASMPTGTRTSTGEAIFMFADPGNYDAGITFLLERQEQIPDLFGQAGTATAADRPAEGDAP